MYKNIHIGKKMKTQMLIHNRIYETIIKWSITQQWKRTIATQHKYHRHNLQWKKSDTKEYISKWSSRKAKLIYGDRSQKAIYIWSWV